MISIDRRSAIGVGLASLGACALPNPLSPSAVERPFIDELERRTFDFFWDLGRSDNGLVPDRWPTPSFCSVAAVGFALTAYPIGVERGWISRSAAAARTLATLRFFDQAPQGPQPSGTAGHRGFFYHFIDMENGHRHRQTELSSVDSTLLFLGMLFAAEWFDHDTTEEQEIRNLATAIVDRADWRWFQRGRRDVSMGWHPETGFIDRGWTGYNEGMMVALLALGSGKHAVEDTAWSGWTSTYPSYWRGQGETRHLAFAPLFGHQYSHAWIDFRGIRDAVMREAGFDYFENSRRATYANRAYCAANPGGWTDYSRDIWGLTACDGPATKIRLGGRQRSIRGYSARGPVGQPDGFDDGTLAPTAIMGSVPFAPEICLPGLKALADRYGDDLVGRYGFFDSFNPSVKGQAMVRNGRVKPRAGWVATDYLGIDQGIGLVMIANHRDGMIWNRMRQSPTIVRGLRRAGFTGGWLDRAVLRP